MASFFEKQFNEVGLGRVSVALAAAVTPCLRLSARPAEDAAIDIGRSKLGGAPDLPPRIDWPDWHGAPLAFLGQINTEELPSGETRDDLPAGTLLSFFYQAEHGTWGFSPGDRGSWRVIASTLAEGPPLRRRPLQNLAGARHLPPLPDRRRRGALGAGARIPDL